MCAKSTWHSINHRNSLACWGFISVWVRVHICFLKLKAYLFIILFINLSIKWQIWIKIRKAETKSLTLKKKAERSQSRNFSCVTLEDHHSNIGLRLPWLTECNGRVLSRIFFVNSLRPSQTNILEDLEAKANCKCLWNSGLSKQWNNNREREPRQRNNKRDYLVLMKF